MAIQEQLAILRQGAEGEIPRRGTMSRPGAFKSVP
jgi:hypothetical protein